MPEITLDNNWLKQWEVAPIRLQKNGIDSKWAILTCSDEPELEIGAPYNPETFKPVDNSAFLELVRESISGTDHKIVSVGSVRNRGRVFVTVELVGMAKFEAAGRRFSAFLNYGNGHDKSSVLWVNTSNTATVCDNTFTMNLISVENAVSKEIEGDDLKLRQRHTKNVTMKLPAMAQLIDKAIGVQAEFQIEFDRLSEVKVNVQTARNIFTGFVTRKSSGDEVSTRATNTVNTLVNLFGAGRGNSGETLADVFSAGTDFYTHLSSGKDNPAKQFLSSEYGSGQVAKNELWTSLRSPEKLDKMIERGAALLAA